MTAASGAAEYFAPQLGGTVPLQDILELRSPTEFFLRGRAADMIKVAGKRASLQELTRQILTMPGVVDAVVFLPDTDARPAAAVVAPGLTAAGILREIAFVAIDLLVRWSSSTHCPACRESCDAKSCWAGRRRAHERDHQRVRRPTVSHRPPVFSGAGGQR